MRAQVSYDVKKLLFRRQFILGPRFVDEFSSWKRIEVGSNICLTVHPDLNAHRAVRNGKSITLLGYVLDPRNPQARDAEILDDLICALDTCDSLDGFFERTYPLGGRWILIVDDGEEIRLFNDPMGLRQVFYTDVSFCRDLWCASQPGIISEVLNLEVDKAVVREFISSDAYETWDECFWPGDTSLYKEIIHLLPNHYLDLNTGSRHRYWPDRNLGSLAVEEGVEIISRLLRGLITSAANRFDLAFTVTAGWDSRLLLAASREISHRVYYFSLLRKVNDPDVIVPSRLLPKLGLEHNVIEYPTRMDDDFARIYKRNVTGSHDLWGRMAQGLYDFYPQDRVCVKGNASEIARARFRLLEGEELTAEKLAAFSSLIQQYSCELSENPYVIRAWEQWLLGVGDTYNIHILDLFYWEHWAGNFAAMSQAEWDIVQEVFTPYNCRRLLTNMLSVDERLRDHDETVFYRELINELWPEVLSEPINPPYRPPMGHRIRQGIRRWVPLGVRCWGLSVRDNIRDRMRLAP